MRLLNGRSAAWVLVTTLAIAEPRWIATLSPAQTTSNATRNTTGTAADLHLEAIPNAKPRNVIFILSDDHRYDAMGFLGHPFLKTPSMDALARGGVHFKNAFVTTALCSPSRASILTGLYAHKHRVVDNNNPVPADMIFFPQYLQAVGYETAFVGKWHMGGDSDAPRRGFDRWVSFRGQGTYLPSQDGLNVDGQHVPQKGYITDELTDYAIDWLNSRKGDKPFFLYLSHKGVHAHCIPAERHRGLYKNAPVVAPKTQANSPENYEGKPMWVKNQRNSWHGVDFPLHSDLDIAEFYRLYCETLLSVDDSVGRVLDFLRTKNLLDSTLIIYMGDNGFLFGEHGLIDKRTAYEESMRVPMLMHCPELFQAGTTVEGMVANIDIAPTILEAAGLKPPPQLDGQSVIPLVQGKTTHWRDTLLYEYFWERNFPQTPTMHAIRTNRYKFIRYYGLWDLDELYDIASDPLETRNLFVDPAHRSLADSMRRQLFDVLEQTNGMSIPMRPDRGNAMNLRKATGSPPANFPPQMMRPK